MATHRNGLWLKQMFHKAQFWIHYSCSVTKMIFHTNCVVNAKLFADNTFSTITSPVVSSSNLDEDVLKVT